MRYPRVVAFAGLLAPLLAPAAPASAQQPKPSRPVEVRVAPLLAEPARPFSNSAARGGETVRVGTDAARAAAELSTGRRLVVSLEDRRLWWIDGADTLLAAPVAVGTGRRLEHEGQEWEFSTPLGERRVLGKARNPTWVPPDWHYVELARDSALRLVRLAPGPGVALADGSRIVVRGDRVGRLLRDGRFVALPAGEEVIFGDTLFIPPLGTVNRAVRGELGAYKLDLGGGILLHGTPHKGSIGTAATHGCIRVRDGELEYLYHHVPVGTRVYIY